MHRWPGGGAFLLFLSIASPLSACPYCESDIGRRVAAGIFNEEFGYNATVALLPLLILAAIVALLHFGLPGHSPARPAVRQSVNKLNKPSA